MIKRVFQQHGVDYSNIFSPVDEREIRLLIALTARLDWKNFPC